MWYSPYSLHSPLIETASKAGEHPAIRSGTVSAYPTRRFRLSSQTFIRRDIQRLRDRILFASRRCPRAWKQGCRICRDASGLLELRRHHVHHAIVCRFVSVSNVWLRQVLQRSSSVRLWANRWRIRKPGETFHFVGSKTVFDLHPQR